MSDVLSMSQSVQYRDSQDKLDNVQVNTVTLQTPCRAGQGGQRTGQALLDNCGIVLEMVQCRLLSEMSLTSVLSWSITVSSLVGWESVE